jgi:hypothetical protein
VQLLLVAFAQHFYAHNYIESSQVELRINETTENVLSTAVCEVAIGRLSANNIQQLNIDSTQQVEISQFPDSLM